MIVNDRIDNYSKFSQGQSTAPNTIYRSSDSGSLSQSYEAVACAAPPPIYSRHRRSDELALAQGDTSSEAEFAQDLSEKSSKSLRSLSLDAEASFQDDGRLQISFGHRLSKRLPHNYAEPVNEIGLDEVGFRDAPPMNVNIMIVGSRGDVQPYLALGQKLQQYGHTVRISTHETFRDLVKGSGLRFFNIGGDPHELMSYMVRNPGLIPGFESVWNGDIGKKQAMVAEMLDKCCLSCYEADEGSPGESGFVADAIISNPPTFAHIHCAEALGIPLLLSFINIKQSGSHEPKAVNYYSYTLVDMLTWQGLSHAINKFRKKKLGLEYLSTASAVTMIERCAIPWTYCISPALVPKPQDWLDHIANNYVPPADLVEFLASGEPPIYVGFGSIVLKDPQQMTEAVLGGIAQAGVRAIVSPGWGGLDEAMIKEAGPHIFALGNVPHDWLFQHAAAVCHHGGAGTTAIGLKCGKPTIIVPFFGDQPWWAAQLAQRGAGPPPLDSKNLTSESFAIAIRAALSADTIAAARDISDIINREDGTKNGVESFHKHLPLLNMRCDLDPKRIAVWYSPTYKLRLSAFSAQVLADRGELDIKKLKLNRSREYRTHALPSDPISGTALPLLRVINNFTHGLVKVGSSRPDKGVLKMATATAGGEYTTTVDKAIKLFISFNVIGLQTVLQGMTEGLTNVPKLYGSEVRESKKVTGFASGVVEGSKGLAYGFYDGITGLVVDPVKGFKEKGALGAAAGIGSGGSYSIVKIDRFY
ncbi:unnamed protein product [Rhizoctonia solani]|uniref:Sterol 3-beta-glucosyltransferase UGT80B1 n=1 Tax=Rhizoctonia solani TaxID=456999 RepID=A0A8H2W8Z5_9AGAM|nr:unnamed protein product [Rhizoctonia solani]